MRAFIITSVASLLLLGTSHGATTGAAEERVDREYLDRVLAGRAPNALVDREAVPSPQAAIAVALAVWSSIYGNDSLSAQEPFVARRIGSYWVVSGTLPRGLLGGNATAVIRAKSGEVLNVSHGR
jgi:hypothetical protein